MEPFFVVVVLFVAALVVGINIFIISIMVQFDKNRIDGFVRERGCRVIEVKWNSRSLWFKSVNFYDVLYVDTEGETKSCEMRTGPFYGVSVMGDDHIKL